jgi:hypothetical protein
VLIKRGLKSLIEDQMNIKLDDWFHLLEEFKKIQFKHKDIQSTTSTTHLQSSVDTIRVQKNKILPYGFNSN